MVQRTLHSDPYRQGTTSDLAIDRADRPHYPVISMTLTHRAPVISCCDAAEAQSPAARRSSDLYSMLSILPSSWPRTLST
jgi:hypothetical protein